jgi:hypothetical protein
MEGDRFKPEWSVTEPGYFREEADHPKGIIAGLEQTIDRDGAGGHCRRGSWLSQVR